MEAILRAACGDMYTEVQIKYYSELRRLESIDRPFPQDKFLSGEKRRRNV